MIDTTLLSASFLGPLPNAPWKKSGLDFSILSTAKICHRKPSFFVPFLSILVRSVLCSLGNFTINILPSDLSNNLIQHLSF